MGGTGVRLGLPTDKVEVGVLDGFPGWVTEARVGVRVGGLETGVRDGRGVLPGTGVEPEAGVGVSTGGAVGDGYWLEAVEPGFTSVDLGVGVGIPEPGGVVPEPGRGVTDGTGVSKPRFSPGLSPELLDEGKSCWSLTT